MCVFHLGTFISVRFMKIRSHLAGSRVQLDPCTPILVTRAEGCNKSIWSQKLGALSTESNHRHRSKSTEQNQEKNSE